MDIGKSIAVKIHQYKLAHHLTTVELAEELHLAVSTTQEYLNGVGNPRADTLEMLAQRMGLSVAELIAEPPPGEPQPSALRQTRSAVHLAKEFARLSPEKREKGIQLFVEMVELFAGEG